MDVALDSGRADADRLGDAEREGDLGRADVDVDGRVKLALTSAILVESANLLYKATTLLYSSTTAAAAAT